MAKRNKTEKKEVSVSSVYVVNKPLTHATHTMSGSINVSTESSGVTRQNFQDTLRLASRRVSEPALRKNET
jgi:hypothetical protein